MAIYKPPKARWPLAVFVGIATFLIGIGIGLLLGNEEPNAAEGVRLVQQELTSAAAGLEVAGIEYAEAVDDGEVVNETEYEGALDALESSRGRFESVQEPLATLAPSVAAEIESAYDDAQGAMEAKDATEDVQAIIDELAELLKGDAGA